ncbi:MAG: DNA helicase II, partial [Verrucomicrobiaceae bacterium]
IEVKGLENKVRVHHFHEWCGEMLRAYHVPLTAEDGQMWDRQVMSVIGGVDGGLIPRGQYGAVLIDEGHDFEPAWLKLVVQMVDPATNSFLLLYDDAQSIYRKRKGPPVSLSSLGVKAAGRTTILRLNYRNSREILKFAYDFAKGSLGPAAADDDHIPLIEPESAGMTGSSPMFRMMERFDEEVGYAARCVNRWLDAGIPANEIAVICFKKWQGEAMAARLKEEAVEHLWMGNPAAKKAYDPGSGKVTVVMAPSSKGLEFQAVVLLGVGDLKDDEKERSAQTRLLYVAMTRAKRQLAVTASKGNAYVKQLAGLGLQMTG